MTSTSEPSTTRPRRIRNIHNLGVEVESIQRSPIWSLGNKRPSTWSPCSATPTTPAPTSPFVNSVWHDLTNAQKEQSVELGPHLVNASWILLRRRASCLFTARAIREASHNHKQSQIVAGMIERKEREIEAIMKSESSDEIEEIAFSPRRALPRSAHIHRRTHKRVCSEPEPIRACA
eukprot:TRINITY_DN43255_c0_g1_i1.p1 TRINITY_DN43255_c0_g1~~TRINITY_DN43255_c0_g1_i1.p1  ORF type:complete len:177 (-),score=18.79 TRINITY_DN43255_c0_g1_i1:388-918(-)